MGGGKTDIRDDGGLFAASTIAARSPKSKSSHSNDTKEIVPRNSLVAVVPSGPEIGYLETADGGRGKPGQKGAFCNARRQRHVPRIVPSGACQRIIGLKEISYAVELGSLIYVLRYYWPYFVGKTKVTLYPISGIFSYQRYI